MCAMASALQRFLGGSVRVWQITSRVQGHPQRARRRRGLMLTTLLGRFETVAHHNMYRVRHLLIGYPPSVHVLARTGLVDSPKARSWRQRWHTSQTSA